MISLKGLAPVPVIMGALLAWSAIYYIAPLMIAIVVFGIHESLRRKKGYDR